MTKPKKAPIGEGKRAHFLLRKLLETGWLEVAPGYHHLKNSVGVKRAFAKLRKVLFPDYL